MAIIKVDIGGKGIGIADQASVDLAKGCANKCKGCYAEKTSRLGHKFSIVEFKEYNDVEFRKSCRAAIRKGIGVARFGKHTDNGDDGLLDTTSKVLSAASDEGLRLVFVTKSLKYNADICKLLKKGNHILHYSLGMLTEAPSDGDRLRAAIEYHKAKVNTKLRVIADVTENARYSHLRADAKNVIVTPMRFASKYLVKEYNANLDNYEFKGGFYRPKFVHKSWSIFKNWCGEVGNDIKCCNCLARKRIY